MDQEALNNLEGSVENISKLNDTLSRIEFMMESYAFKSLDYSEQVKYYGKYDTSMVNYLFTVYSTYRTFVLVEIFQHPSAEMAEFENDIIHHPENINDHREMLDQLAAKEMEMQDELLYEECFVRVFRNAFSKSMNLDHNELTMCQASRYNIHKLFSNLFDAYKIKEGK